MPRLRRGGDQQIFNFLAYRELGLQKVHRNSFSSIKSCDPLQKYAEEKASLPSKLQTCEVPPPNLVKSTLLVTLSPNGTLIASSHGDHTVRITEVATGKCVRVLRGHPRSPWCLQFHPVMSNILASGCLEGEVRIWDIQNGGSEMYKTDERLSITSIAFHPLDNVVVFSCGNKLCFWDWKEPEPFAICRTKYEYEKIRWVKFDPFGLAVYTGIANGSVIVAPSENYSVFLGSSQREPSAYERIRRSVIRNRLPLPFSASTRYPEVGTRFGDSSTRYPETGTRFGESSTRYPESGTGFGDTSTRYPELGTRFEDSSSRYPEMGNRFESGFRFGDSSVRYPELNPRFGESSSAKYPELRPNFDSGFRYARSGDSSNRNPDSNIRFGDLSSSRYPEASSSRYRDSASRYPEPSTRFNDSLFGAEREDRRRAGAEGVRGRDDLRLWGREEGREDEEAGGGRRSLYVPQPIRERDRYETLRRMRRYVMLNRERETNAARNAPDVPQSSGESSDEEDLSWPGFRHRRRLRHLYSSLRTSGDENPSAASTSRNPRWMSNVGESLRPSAASRLDRSLGLNPARNERVSDSDRPSDGASSTLSDLNRIRRTLDRARESRRDWLSTLGTRDSSDVASFRSGGLGHYYRSSESSRLDLSRDRPASLSGATGSEDVVRQVAEPNLGAVGRGDGSGGAQVEQSRAQYLTSREVSQNTSSLMEYLRGVGSRSTAGSRVSDVLVPSNMNADYIQPVSVASGSLSCIVSTRSQNLNSGSLDVEGNEIRINLTSGGNLGQGQSSTSNSSANGNENDFEVNNTGDVSAGERAFGMLRSENSNMADHDGANEQISSNFAESSHTTSQFSNQSQTNPLYRVFSINSDSSNFGDLTSSPQNNNPTAGLNINDTRFSIDFNRNDNEDDIESSPLFNSLPSLTTSAVGSLLQHSPTSVQRDVLRFGFDPLLPQMEYDGESNIGSPLNASTAATVATEELDEMRSVAESRDDDDDSQDGVVMDSVTHSADVTSHTVTRQISAESRQSSVYDILDLNSHVGLDVEYSDTRGENAESSIQQDSNDRNESNTNTLLHIAEVHSAENGGNHLDGIQDAVGTSANQSLLSRHTGSGGSGLLGRSARWSPQVAQLAQQQRCSDIRRQQLHSLKCKVLSSLPVIVDRISTMLDEANSSLGVREDTTSTSGNDTLITGNQQNIEESSSANGITCSKEDAACSDQDNKHAGCSTIENTGSSEIHDHSKCKGKCPNKSSMQSGADTVLKGSSSQKMAGKRKCSEGKQLEVDSEMPADKRICSMSSAELDKLGNGVEVSANENSGSNNDDGLNSNAAGTDFSNATSVSSSRADDLISVPAGPSSEIAGFSETAGSGSVTAMSGSLTAGPSSLAAASGRETGNFGATLAKQIRDCIYEASRFSGLRVRYEKMLRRLEVITRTSYPNTSQQAAAGSLQTAAGSQQTAAGSQQTATGSLQTAAGSQQPAAGSLQTAAAGHSGLSRNGSAAAANSNATATSFQRSSSANENSASGNSFINEDRLAVVNMLRQFHSDIRAMRGTLEAEMAADSGTNVNVEHTSSNITVRPSSTNLQSDTDHIISNSQHSNVTAAADLYPAAATAANQQSATDDAAVGSASQQSTPNAAAVGSSSQLCTAAAAVESACQLSTAAVGSASQQSAATVGSTSQQSAAAVGSTSRLSVHGINMNLISSSHHQPGSQSSESRNTSSSSTSGASAQPGRPESPHDLLLDAMNRILAIHERLSGRNLSSVNQANPPVRVSATEQTSALRNEVVADRSTSSEGVSGASSQAISQPGPSRGIPRITVMEEPPAPTAGPSRGPAISPAASSRRRLLGRSLLRPNHDHNYVNDLSNDDSDDNDWLTGERARTRARMRLMRAVVRNRRRFWNNDDDEDEVDDQSFRRFRRERERRMRLDEAADAGEREEEDMGGFMYRRLFRGLGLARAMQDPFAPHMDPLGSVAGDDTAYRIQRWDFASLQPPDLTQSNADVIVHRARLITDASCDISQDGRLLCVILPPSSHSSNRDERIGVYSLVASSLGQCLYVKAIGRETVSVSLSPRNNFLLVGLSSKKYTWIFSPKLTVAQVFQLKNPTGDDESTEHVCDIVHPCLDDPRMPVRLNAARWLVGSGEGLVYGTNRGDLNIYRPGYDEKDKNVQVDLDLSLETNPLRRNLLQLLGIGGAPRTTSTATQTGLNVLRSASTQTEPRGANAPDQPGPSWLRQ